MARLSVGRTISWVLVSTQLGCFDAGEPSASGGSGGASNTSGSTTAATTTSTSGTAGASTTGATTGDLGKAEGYRITSLKLVDPHLYFILQEGGECVDVTSLVNSWLDGEVEDGNVSQVLVFFPTVTDAGEETPMMLTNATCNGALDTCSEDVELGDAPVMSVATNASDAKVCSISVNGTWNPDYNAEGSPNLPNAPCFSSASATGTVRIAGSDNLPALPLSEVRVAASYTLAESGMVTGLVTGSIRGYLSKSEADAIMGNVTGLDLPFNLWGSTAGGDGCQPDPDSPIDDTDPNPDVESDDGGAWIYLNFEATKVEWL